MDQTNLRQNTRRATPWRAVFLESLRKTANVSYSAKVAGVRRSSAYRARDKSVSFASKWDDALEEGIAALEEAARVRAFEGVDEPVFQGGIEVGAKRVYSDRLAELLLKAHRPEKYRERHDIKTDIMSPPIINIRGVDPVPE